MVVVDGSGRGVFIRRWWVGAGRRFGRGTGKGREVGETGVGGEEQGYILRGGPKLRRGELGR